MLRRTKIVATLGPATQSADTVGRLVAAGMDVARVNGSHGDTAQHAASIAAVRAAAAQAGRAVAVVFDLPGPKLRLAGLSGRVQLQAGQQVVLGGEQLPVTAPQLLRYVREGDRILVDDGAVALTALKAADTTLTALVDNEGAVTTGKGINLPDTDLPIPSLTERDHQLLRFAVEQDVDYVALSFVRRGADVRELKDAIGALGGGQLVVAKIEKQEALAVVDDIVGVADAVMVARGDLGVEIEPAQVPIWQKRIIHSCIMAGRPVITATQMLQSMVSSPRPTRAEASDVANAIYDATDAVMLSAETAIGDYPVQAVHTMDQIAVAVEADIERSGRAPRPWALHGNTITDAISFGACDVATKLDARAIVTATSSGATARAVARYRPSQAVVAVSPEPRVVRQLALAWGVVPLCCPPATDSAAVVADAARLVAEHGLAVSGDIIVITAGVQSGRSGATDLIQAHVVA